MLDHGVARAVEALQAGGATGWHIEAPLRPAGAGAAGQVGRGYLAGGGGVSRHPVGAGQGLPPGTCRVSSGARAGRGRRAGRRARLADDRAGGRRRCCDRRTRRRIRRRRSTGSSTGSTRATRGASTGRWITRASSSASPS
jgi:hypothetical protein